MRAGDVVSAYFEPARAPPRPASSAAAVDSPRAALLALEAPQALQGGGVASPDAIDEVAVRRADEAQRGEERGRAGGVVEAGPDDGPASAPRAALTSSGTSVQNAYSSH